MPFAKGSTSHLSVLYPVSLNFASVEVIWVIIPMRKSNLIDRRVFSGVGDEDSVVNFR